MEASSKNHCEIVRELLLAGADASLSNDVRKNHQLVFFVSFYDKICTTL